MCIIACAYFRSGFVHRGCGAAVASPVTPDCNPNPNPDPNPDPDPNPGPGPDPDPKHNHTLPLRRVSSMEVTNAYLTNVLSPHVITIAHLCERHYTCYHGINMCLAYAQMLACMLVSCAYIMQVRCIYLCSAGPLNRTIVCYVYEATHHEFFEEGVASSGGAYPDNED